MMKMPSISIVPMTLAKPRGLYAWEALDRSRKTHHLSAQWILPDFYPWGPAPKLRPAVSVLTGQWRSRPLDASVGSHDNQDLDYNVLVKKIVGFTRVMNWHSLPTDDIMGWWQEQHLSRRFSFLWVSVCTFWFIFLKEHSLELRNFLCSNIFPTDIRTCN